MLPDVPSMIVPPGFSSAGALGVLDHLDRHPVLDRVARVEGLDLREDRALDHAAGDAVDAHHRRVPDRRGWCRRRSSLRTSVHYRVRARPATAPAINSAAVARRDREAEERAEVLRRGEAGDEQPGDAGLQVIVEDRTSIARRDLGEQTPGSEEWNLRHLHLVTGREHDLIDVEGDARGQRDGERTGALLDAGNLSARPRAQRRRREPRRQPGLQFQPTFLPETLVVPVALLGADTSMPAGIGGELLHDRRHPAPVRLGEPRRVVAVGHLHGSGARLRRQRGPFERTLPAADDQTSPATWTKGRRSHTYARGGPEIARSAPAAHCGNN